LFFIAVLTYPRSDDATLWMALGGLITLGAAITGYIIGLFLPASFSIFANFGLGIAAWSVIGAIGWIMTRNTSR